VLFLFFESLILFHLFSNSLKEEKEAAENASTSKYIFLSMSLYEIRTPIIALIALGLLVEQNKILNAGMDNFIIKPFYPIILFDKIVKYIILRNEEK
jgi:CheY-like chemotaxis protein